MDLLKISVYSQIKILISISTNFSSDNHLSGVIKVRNYKCSYILQIYSSNYALNRFRLFIVTCA